MAMLAVASRIKLTVWPLGSRRARAINCGPSAYVRVRCGVRAVSDPLAQIGQHEVGAVDLVADDAEVLSYRTGVGTPADAVPQEAGGLWLVGVGVSGAGVDQQLGPECLADRASANEADQAAGEAV